ncbi:MAG TPA: ABC transporter permease [Anaerolineaceae bacterium]
MITTAHKPSGFDKFLRRHPTLQGLLFVSPAAIWLFLFLVLPLLLVLIYSFWTHGIGGTIIREFTLENYARFFTVSVYSQIMWRSFLVGIETTFFALLLCYPTAYYLANRRSSSNMLIFLIMVPFFTSYLIRIYSWVLILMEKGVANYLLLHLGLVQQPARLLFTPFAVVIGMTYSALPFMILPIYAVLRGLDHRLVEAAKTLGANDLQAFLQVTLPLSMPGIVTGGIIVFIQGAGNFLAPAILGGTGADLMANVIADRFLEASNWPLGSALAMIFLVVMGIFMIVVNKYVALEDIYGSGQ